MEYHLYLYVPDNDLWQCTFAITVEEVENLIEEFACVKTFQICTLSTRLFKLGYRIFIHDEPGSNFEITLGNCARTAREIKMGTNLERLLLAGEFDKEK